MPESWDWIEEELKKIQGDMPADAEMMQVVDAISVADFWKRRYDEELMLWERKLELKESERRGLQEKAQTHEMAIKELDFHLKELERRWEHEKLLLEDRLKAKEVESVLEKMKLEWETRLKVLEQENLSLKGHLGQSEGIAFSPSGYFPPSQAGRPNMPPPPPLPRPASPGHPDAAQGGVNPAAAQFYESRLKELEEGLRHTEQQAKERLEKLEAEKREVAAALAEKEKTFAQEREQWSKAEKEVGQMSNQKYQQLEYIKDREKEHFIILEDLARGFAHKVRNYLGIMSGTIQLCVASYQMDNELKEQLNLVDQNAQEMLKAIEEFLALARIPEMNLSSFNLSQVLEGVLMNVDAKIKAQGITVNKSLSIDLPPLEGDKKMFEEAFDHLLQNAVESMPQGGQLTLATSFDRTRGVINIKITDTGVGISESHIKKVFQPYFSSKKARKGLGTTIAKRVVDLHRGTLMIESVKGKGSTVNINILLDPAK